VNVAGLNNLAFSQKPQTAAKGGTSSKGNSKESSFEDVLGQTSNKPRAEEAPPRHEQPKQDTQTSKQRPEAEVESRTARPENPRERQREIPSHEDVSRAPQAAEGRAGETAAREDSVRESGVREDAGGEMDAESIDPGAFQGAPMQGPVLGNPLISERLTSAQPVTSAQMLMKNAAAAKDDDGVDSLTRRVVWTDFLRKMKEDLGVSAEDVLHAFGSLSKEDLAKPPTETVDKVVMALGLNDQQAMLAKQYFQELIHKTQSRSLGEELNTSGKQIGLSLMSERELDRKNVQRRLDQMNESFFMQGQYARPMQPAPQTAAQRMAQNPMAQPNSVRIDGDGEQAQRSERTGMSVSAMTPDLGRDALTAPAADMQPVAPQAPSMAAQAATVNPQAQRQIDQLTAQMQPADENDRTADQLVQKLIGAQTPGAIAKAKVAMAAAASQAPDTATKTAQPAIAAAPAMTAASLNKLLASLEDGKADADDGGGEMTDASYLNAPLLPADSKLNSPIQTGNDFQTQLAQVKPGQPMAVPDLVQQAQVMLRDGGGEMKVTLNPEGLGEVAMKVSVDQGKVNVQMITESDEAKRLIERQLGELKSSLTSNHLQVSDIKVDTASNLGKQLEQQYRDAQRQNLQASWDQFRQDNQGWRRSFFETPSARNYKGTADAPRDVSAPGGSSSSAAARARSAKRLDLVA
jgi:flagellar hook-length control protein FliK